MPHLRVTFADGREEHRALSRTEPVTIGAMSFNDICAAGSDVGPLHCRVGWNKQGFEVTAATSKGVNLNGQVVQQALLKPGDRLQVGQVSLVFAQGEAQAIAAGAIPDASTRHPDDLSLFEGPVYSESDPQLQLEQDLDERSDTDRRRRVRGTDDHGESHRESREERRRRRREAGAFDGDDDDDDDDQLLAAMPRAEGSESGAGQRTPELLGGRARPGEQEIFKSPLVLLLGSGSLVLLLVAAVIWFLMSRESQEQMFERGIASLAEGKFAVAIGQLQEFQQKYPNHSKSRAAELALQQARIQQELSGSERSWGLAFERLAEVRTAERSRNDYESAVQPMIRDFAQQICSGAAKAAAQLKQPELLTLATKAFDRWRDEQDKEAPSTGMESQLRNLLSTAETAIARQQQLVQTLARMDQELRAQRPIEALRARDELLSTLPQFANEPQLQQRLTTALAAEQSAAQPDETVADGAAATAAEMPPPSHFVSPVYHTRSRTDVVSTGQTVWLTLSDAVFGVDAITGEPRWRQTTGPDQPFAPVVISTSPTQLVWYHTSRQELWCCTLETGQPVWRSPLLERPRAAPLFQAGQLYLPVDGGALLRFDARTGALTSRLQFSQELVGSAAAAPDGEHLWLAGAAGVIYTVATHPPQCQAVTFTNHASGAVRTAPVVMGRLLLLCDNDRQDRCRLRLFTTDQLATSLVEVTRAEQRIPGQVVDPPALRGQQLVVATRGQQLAGFVVDDAIGREALSPVGQYRVQDPYDGPMAVRLGPDNQFWIASTAFRRFEFGTDTLKMDAQAVATGLISQPLQLVDEALVVARRPIASAGVTMTSVDRTSLVGTWRLSLGGTPRHGWVTNSGSLVLVHDSGLVSQLSATRLQQGGFDLASTGELELPASDPLRPWLFSRQPSGKVVAVWNGEPRSLWKIDPDGRISTPPWALPDVVDVAPAELADGWLLPLPEQLQYRGGAKGSTVIDWPAPLGDAAVRWHALVAVSRSDVLVSEVSGRVRRIEWQPGEQPTLQEQASVPLPELSPLAPQRANDRIAYFGLEGSLHVLETTSLDTVAMRPGDRSWAFGWAVGSRWLCGDSDGHWLCFDADAEPQDVWVLADDRPEIVSPPWQESQRWWCALSDQRVVAIDPNTGDILYEWTAPQPLTAGPWRQHNALWVAAHDGTVYRLPADAPLESAAEPAAPSTPEPTQQSTTEPTPQSTTQPSPTSTTEPDQPSATEPADPPAATPDAAPDTPSTPPAEPPAADAPSTANAAREMPSTMNTSGAWLHSSRLTLLAVASAGRPS
jgi:outer membrane protein assembly factor BamB